MYRSIDTDPLFIEVIKNVILELINHKRGYLNNAMYSDHCLMQICTKTLQVSQPQFLLYVSLEICAHALSALNRDSIFAIIMYKM